MQAGLLRPDVRDVLLNFRYSFAFPRVWMMRRLEAVMKRRPGERQLCSLLWELLDRLDVLREGQLRENL